MDAIASVGMGVAILIAENQVGLSKDRQYMLWVPSPLVCAGAVVRLGQGHGGEIVRGGMQRCAKQAQNWSECERDCGDERAVQAAARNITADTSAATHR